MVKTSARLVIDGSASGADILLYPVRNLVTGSAAFGHYFGDITTLELDLLNVASTIYAVDVGAPRGVREEHTRSFHVELPVTNHHAFLRTADDLRYCLYLLTNDTWELSFTQAEGIPEESRTWDRGDGTTLLFSGGLDSLAQAVLLAEIGDDFCLVSHDSGNQTIAIAQEELADYVNRIAVGDCHRHTFRVRGENRRGFPYPTVHEPSQRARSLLFAALGALVGRRTGHWRVLYIAENGHMAIHLPLTAARIGAFSTHTAHPEVVSLFTRVFSQLLGTELSFENPFLYQTKGEVVKALCRDHQDILCNSISCWKASWVEGESNHCGECIPCIVRRVALESNGDYTTSWARDLFVTAPGDLDESDNGKRNLVELAEFAMKFLSISSNQELGFEFPELYNDAFSFEKAVRMYRRFAREVISDFRRYPSLSGLTT